MYTIAVSILLELSVCPAESVAQTTPAITPECMSTETNPVPASLLSRLRLDSISTSNTNVAPGNDGIEILPTSFYPLVGAALQNDDSRVIPGRLAPSGGFGNRRGSRSGRAPPSLVPAPA